MPEDAEKDKGDERGKKLPKYDLKNELCLTNSCEQQLASLTLMNADGVNMFNSQQEVKLSCLAILVKVTFSPQKNAQSVFDAVESKEVEEFPTYREIFMST